MTTALFEADLNFTNGMTALKEAERQFKLGQQKLDEAKRLSRDLFGKLGIYEPPTTPPTEEDDMGEQENGGGKHDYELDGEADYINRLALKATMQLAERTDSFEQMCQTVDQEYVMPAKGRLKMWVLADRVHEHTSNPRKRYFIDHPITTKDGKVIYCTTQWAAKQLDKETGEYVDGAFIRFAEEMAKAGIYIKKVQK